MFLGDIVHIFENVLSYVSERRSFSDYAMIGVFREVASGKVLLGPIMRLHRKNITLFMEVVHASHLHTTRGDHKVITLPGLVLLKKEV